MNDSTSHESILFQQMLHDFIILMGVCSQISNLALTPANTSTGNSMIRSISRKSVNGSIWLMIQPCSILNPIISRVLTFYKSKCCCKVLLIIFYNVAVSKGNILFQQLSRWIIFIPLVWISIFTHKNPCLRI